MDDSYGMQIPGMRTCKICMQACTTCEMLSDQQDAQSDFDLIVSMRLCLRGHAAFACWQVKNGVCVLTGGKGGKKSFAEAAEL